MRMEATGDKTQRNPPAPEILNVSFTPSMLRTPHPAAADPARSGRHDWDAGIGCLQRR